jgi:hypothetical protein
MEVVVLKMVQDNFEEYRKTDWTKLCVYGGLLGGTIWFWYSIFSNGFFISIMWLIVISAILGICLRLSGRV